MGYRGRSGEHEDAERVAGRVGEDVERLFGVGGPVLEHPGAERQRTVALLEELLEVGDVEVEVKLLGDLRVGPGRGAELGHVLHGEARLARLGP